MARGGEEATQAAITYTTDSCRQSKKTGGARLDTRSVDGILFRLGEGGQSPRHRNKNYTFALWVMASISRFEHPRLNACLLYMQLPRQ